VGLMTNPIVIRARDLARLIGVTPMLSRMLGHGRYEARFGDAILDSIRAGDVVWDIGANVGHYTELFAKRAGQNGRVIAFEPSPENAMTLRSLAKTVPSVVVMEMALGNTDGRTYLLVGTDRLGATSTIGNNTANKPSTEVEIRAGDSIVETNPIYEPNIVKIDVEGHEISVLKGMLRTLSSARARAVFVELHFGLLKARALSPSDAVTLLTSAGYEIRWLDASHLMGTRRLRESPPNVTGAPT
jgi:FkbM family methyltransferase